MPTIKDVPRTSTPVPPPAADRVPASGGDTTVRGHDPTDRRDAGSTARNPIVGDVGTEAAKFERQLGIAEQMLTEGQLERARDLLKSIVPGDTSGKANALLADTFFLLQQYDEAEWHYRIALSKQPNDLELRDRVARSYSNALAGIANAVPDRELFDAKFTRDKLLAGPNLPDLERTFAKIIELKGFPWFMDKVKGAVGGVVSAGADSLFKGIEKLAGASGTNDEVWTNWYKTGKGMPDAVGNLMRIFKLAYMRGTLFENNLVNPYPAGAKTGFYGTDGEPPEWVKHWRTPDGSWNNLRKDPDGRYDPMVGAAMTRFYRNFGDDKGIEAIRPRADPAKDPVSVRELSRVFCTLEGEAKKVPFLNMLAASWIQFMVHDWVSHGEPSKVKVDHIPLAPDDPARKRYHVSEMLIRATSEDPTRMPEEKNAPPTYVNEVTHWWDGSQIYGSDKETQNKLRSHSDGKMAVTAEGNLPVDPETGIEMTGVNRNWWVGLDIMHTLFVREHNAICDKLKSGHPDWDDERLFQTARLINAAVMAKIHTVEWTPAILPNPTLSDAMHSNWYGLLTNLFSKAKHKQAIESLQLKNRELGGILGNAKGVFAKYGLSEEFTSVYRMHSLLPDHVDIKLPDGTTKELRLDATRQQGATALMHKVGLADLIKSQGEQHPHQLVANNFPKQLQEMAMPGQAFFDLAAADLYRDRERGVPPYNQLRRELGLNPIRTYDDLTEDKGIIAKLRATYGVDEAGKDKVEDIDPMIGMLCEGHRPEGFGFGETAFQVFILNASWRLLGDRFYTDSYNAETYSQEGLDWIDEATMKGVILRHMPELADSGLGNVKNAFEPHEEGRLDATKHPLRGFDKALKDDPFSGERAHNEPKAN